MQVLKSLTKRDILLNKKRSIGITLGIALSAALITCVLGMFFVVQESMVQVYVNQNGYYHIKLDKIPDSELDSLSNNKDFSNVVAIKSIGEGELPLIYDEDINYDVNVYSLKREDYDFLKIYINIGDYPSNNTEIVVDNYYYSYNNLNLNDMIKISLKDEITGEVEEHEYKIVGVSDKPSSFFTTGEKSSTNTVYMTLKNPWNYKDSFDRLLKDKNYSYNKNNDLLRYEAFDFRDEILSFLFYLVGIIILIIVGVSIFSIRNSFAISATEKLKEFGMLRSVGTTRRQLKEIVLLEGLYLGLIGTVSGVILGSAVVYLLTVIVNSLLDMSLLYSRYDLLYYKFSFIPIVVASLFSVIVIYLSTINGRRKASKVSPITSIRLEEEFTNKRKLRVPKFINKIFGVGGLLAYKNLKRSKKKYRVTVISLTVSIVVYITVSSFLGYFTKMVKMEFYDLHYNLEARLPYDEDVDLKKLVSLDEEAYVTYEVRYSDLGSIYLKDTSHILIKDIIDKNFCTNYNEDYPDDCAGEFIEALPVNLFVYDDTTFRKIAKETHSNYEYIKDKVVVINKSQKEEEKVIIYDTADYKKGDKISFYYNKGKETSIDYTVGLVTDYRPVGLEVYYPNNPLFLINRDYFEYQNSLVPAEVFYNSKDTTKLEENIKKVDPNIRINNITAAVRLMRGIIIVLDIFIYGFMIVVTLIGVTSVFNTITSNMQLRSREFAIIKSIGMTKKEFNKMVLLESIFYSSKSLLYGIVIGNILGIFVYRIFKFEYDAGYMFPYKAVLVSAIVVIIFVYLIMKYSINKINKENIIETIRRDVT